MVLRNLAEAIILQSMEDIWSPDHREQSMDFFNGEGFNICAELAGMCPSDRSRFRKILAGSEPGLNCTN